MTSKTYLRYVPRETFGVIASSGANVLFDKSGTLAITAAIHNIAVWNLRRGCQEYVLKPEEDSGAEETEISHLTLSADEGRIAAGYTNGMVRVFNLSTNEVEISLNGHKSAVLSGRFSPQGGLLATGGADTDVVVWDVVAESGLYRLRGHNDGVTDVAFVTPRLTSSSSGKDDGDGDDNGVITNGGEKTKSSTASRKRPRHQLQQEGQGELQSQLQPSFVITCSKDTLVKVWDLATQHCIQTIVGHRSEVWSLDVNPDGTRLITGASDNQLRMWSLQQPSASDGDDAKSDGVGGGSGKPEEEDEDKVAVYMGSFARENNDRALCVRFHRKAPLIGVQAAGKVIEIVRVRSEAEVKKKKKRRLKRFQEKSTKAAKEAAQRAAGIGKNGIVLTFGAAATWGTEEGGEGGGGVGAKGQSKDDNNGTAILTPASEEGRENVITGDELELLTVIRSHHKIRAFDFSPELSRDFSSTQLIVSHHNNSLELWKVQDIGGSHHHQNRHGKEGIDDANAGDGGGDGGSAHLLSTLDMHGHRGDVRAVALSSDSQLLASVGNGLVKVWNAASKNCIRSCVCGFGLCLAFAPGDRHLFVGTKQGSLQVFELSSGEMLQDYEAHQGALWAMDIRPDRQGMVTGGEDHQVKFWEFEVVNKNLGMVHTRTLKMSDDVLCVRYSKHKQEDKLLLAVALLDCTVKVFFDNSLKFFLSLYGHKLPVMSIDISDDGELIATGSADKTIKIWGLDFGDCHRSLLAHADSIMGLKFVGGTHYIFTASKDKTVKYWDCDHFEQILELKGHRAEVWGLAVSADGSFVLTGGHDRSLRIWERTEEMVFLEEEREKALDAMFEKDLERADAAGGGAAVGSGIENGGDKLAPPGSAGPNDVIGESALASRRSVESVKAGERLMDALELAMAENEEIKAYKKATKNALKKGKDPPPPRRANMLLLNLSPMRYMLRALQMIKLPELEQALIVLPFSQVEALAKFLMQLLQHGLEVELCARCAIFLVRIHQAPIVANHAMIKTLEALRFHLRRQLEGARDAIGTNIAGLKMIQSIMEADKHAYSFETEEDRLAKKIRQVHQEKKRK